MLNGCLRCQCLVLRSGPSELKVHPMEPDSTGGMQFHSGKGMFRGGPAQIPEELQEDRRLSLPIIRIGMDRDL